MTYVTHYDDGPYRSHSAVVVARGQRWSISTRLGFSGRTTDETADYDLDGLTELREMERKILEAPTNFEEYGDEFLRR
jgi:hypothetical protein